MIKVVEISLCMYLKTISPDVPRFTFVCSIYNWPISKKNIGQAILVGKCCHCRINDRFPEVSMLQQRNQSLFIISTYTILQAQHNDCSYKLFLISSLRKIYKFRMLFGSWGIATLFSSIIHTHKSSINLEHGECCIVSNSFSQIFTSFSFISEP